MGVRELLCLACWAVSINLAAVPPVPWLTQQSVTKHLMIKTPPKPKDKSCSVFQACAARSD